MISYSVVCENIVTCKRRHLGAGDLQRQHNKSEICPLDTMGASLVHSQMRAAEDRNESFEQVISSVGSISCELSLFFCGWSQILPQNIGQISPIPLKNQSRLGGFRSIFGRYSVV
jgi:hypothetical protein